ncbi:MAG: class I SAM-dependent methyltransferase [Chthoniobacterales bacterium]|nr:class I SAM-dependent methyltransferase [Chthoniobacterales bacterium]
MREINNYARQLSPAEIEAGVHRKMVGGMWEEIGRLQFEFLRAKGMKPSDRFLDIGCGALRGGLHAIAYLEAGHYCGLDSNRSLIEAGRRELKLAALEEQTPRLALNEQFELGLFEQQFEYLLALSVFTHLFANHIVRCLVEVRKVLAPGGRFFATFFLAPAKAHLAPIIHQPGGVTTHYDRDPFHYSVDEIAAMAGLAGLAIELIGDWNHPRAQQMVIFSAPNGAATVRPGGNG